MKIILAHLVQSIITTTRTSGGTTLEEMGLTIADLKKEVSEIADSCDRRQTSDAREWAQWFQMDDAEKSELIKQARKEAKTLTA